MLSKEEAMSKREMFFTDRNRKVEERLGICVGYSFHSST